MANQPRQALPQNMREKMTAHPETTIVEADVVYRRARGFNGFVALTTAEEPLRFYDGEGKEVLNMAG